MATLAPLHCIPLRAIIGPATAIQADVVRGALSCVFWTLTLQTTVKYVILILRADNRGEGGIFALYALIRRHARWLNPTGHYRREQRCWPMASLHPPSRSLRPSKAYGYSTPTLPTVLIIEIVMVILTILFLIQAFGTSVVGTAFGPIMLVWFIMLGTLGAFQIVHAPADSAL